MVIGKQKMEKTEIWPNMSITSMNIPNSPIKRHLVLNQTENMSLRTYRRGDNQEMEKGHLGGSVGSGSNS